MSRKKPAPTVQELVSESMSGIADEATRHDARDREQAERRERRAARARQAAILLIPMCLILTGLNVSGAEWLISSGPPSLAEPQATIAAMELLSDAQDELAVARANTGRYPQVPDFIGPDGFGGDDEPFRYDLMGSDRYVISVTVDGVTVNYDSRQDPDQFFREVRDAR